MVESDLGDCLRLALIIDQAQQALGWRRKRQVTCKTKACDGTQRKALLTRYDLPRGDVEKPIIIVDGWEIPIAIAAPMIRRPRTALDMARRSL
jgi:hypothetical protein